MGFFSKTEDSGTTVSQELVDLRAAIEKARLPETAAPVALKELERLEKTDPGAAEYMIGLNYLDFIVSLPWNKYTNDNLDIDRAERILERSHFGLTNVKERVLEYLSVRALRSQRTFHALVVDDEEMARQKHSPCVGQNGP